MRDEREELFTGSCGNCIEFEYDGQNHKGFCRRRGVYYYPDDSCQYQKDRGYQSGGCFLTTACCEYKGLPDDCEELTLLRKFRDEVMLKTEEGRQAVKFYYQEAPRIIERINTMTEKAKIYDWVFQMIHTTMADIDKQDNGMAMTRYLFMMYKLDLCSIYKDLVYLES